MKRILFIVFLLPMALVAQNHNLVGTVLDKATNQPLEGAFIRNQNNIATTTNSNGEFSITCSQKITISYVGFESVVINNPDCSVELNISLESENSKLNEVELTSTSSSKKSFIYQPISISKLDQKEINRGQGLFMDDAINANVPGVYMSRRGVASGQQFNIRGYGNGVGFRGASNNFDSQGSKVYLNGIPVTDAEGITVMDDIDFASIGNVEITKGPSGSIYGLSIAGVVNLKSISPEKGKTSMGQSVQLGDYGVQRYTTTLQSATDKSSVLLNYGYQKADGFMAHTASNKDFFNFIGEFNPSIKRKVTSYFGYSNSYDQRGGELTIDEFANRDYSGNSRYIKNNAHSEVIRFRAGIGHEYKFNSHISNSTMIFGSAASMNSSSAGGWNDNHPMNYGLRSIINFDYNLGESYKLTGLVGFEGQQQRAQPISYNMVADSSNLSGYNIIGSQKGNQVSKTNNYSYFTEWTLSLNHGWAVTAGLGVNNMGISLDNRLYDALSIDPTHYEIQYKNLISPRLSVNKVFKEKYSVYASYSQGYKTPVSSNIIISGTGELNKDLKPENGNQFEVGTKGSVLNGKLNYELALFRATFTNKMTSVAVPLDSVTTDYTYITNGGGQINQCLEASIRYTAYESNTKFLQRVNFWGNVTLNDFAYDKFYYESVPRGQSQAVKSVYNGNAVAGVSGTTFNLGVDVNLKYGWYGNVSFNYKGEMPITSDGKFMTDPYSLLNAKLGYKTLLGKHFDFEVFAGANNITSTQYYYMVFVNQLADAYLPAPDKINFFGGVNLKYVF